MSEPAPLQVDDALDELVNQFSDPFSFLRELVQNALDAGSEEVEVRVEYEKGADGEAGVAVVRVDDWGDGMNREIITKRLTRLFSSAKDGDMTKIGKFGIGFVSVFAIEPDAVCVDTSRDGENWRVLFDEDRAFKLLSVDTPVDGTKIRIFKKIPEEEFPSFAKRAEQTLRYWCKHTAGEVRFGDALIAEPFDLDAPCKVIGDDGFSKIVVAHALDGEPFFGFYNTGLTLIEGALHERGSLAYKVSSPHLEHTLTRDNVIEDQGKQRVLDALDALIDGDLMRTVFEKLAAELARPVPSELREYLYRAALLHARRGVPESQSEGVVAMTPSGRAVTIGEIGECSGGVSLARQESPLTIAAEEAGVLVLALPSSGSAAALVSALSADGVASRELAKAFAAVGAVDEQAGDWEALSTHTKDLLDHLGWRCGRVCRGSFEYPESPIAGRVAITRKEGQQLVPLSEVDLVTQGVFAVERELVANADHPIVRRAVALATREPGLAAYVLLKAFALGSTLDAEIDGRMAARVLERRRAR